MNKYEYILIYLQGYVYIIKSFMLNSLQTKTTNEVHWKTQCLTNVIINWSYFKN